VSGKTGHNVPLLLDEIIKKVLIEERLQIKNEYYLAITYDTSLRTPTIILSKFGGIDIEETKKQFPERVIMEQINILEGVDEQKAKKIATKAEIPQIAALLKKLYDFFMEKDMKLLEINPLAEIIPDQKSAHEPPYTNEVSVPGIRECALFCLDAKIILDDDAFFRQQFSFPPRMNIGREKTEREIAANKINEQDHRGVAGKTYIDLNGDIAILASGGGASITAVDALLSYGQRPANYTEYSGNPSPEKVEALTRIVLSKPNLNGLFVVGAKANFTQVHETIAAIIKVIQELKPEYPIVFRRAGPGDREAKQLVEKTAKEFDLDMEWYGEETPITVAAKRMAEKVKEQKRCCC
jgi:succinyl-CoA synthetase beta subunit